jgi:hypothetical protein
MSDIKKEIGNQYREKHKREPGIEINGEYLLTVHFMGFVCDILQATRDELLESNVKLGNRISEEAEKQNHYSGVLNGDQIFKTNKNRRRVNRDPRDGSL